MILYRTAFANSQSIRQLPQYRHVRNIVLVPTHGFLKNWSLTSVVRVCMMYGMYVCM